MADDPFFVPTRSSKALNQSAHLVVVHKEEKISEPKKPVKKRDVVDELDMKQARFEIYKFAQSGLSNPDKQKNQKELALKLGAVPPKNKAVNYKLYKKELAKTRKKEKETEALAKLGYVHRPVRSFKKSSRNPKAKLNKKMDIGTGILKKYGKVKK